MFGLFGKISSPLWSGVSSAEPRSFISWYSIYVVFSYKNIFHSQCRTKNLRTQLLDTKKKKKKLKQHLVTFRSKSSSDKRKTTTYTWKSNYHVAIFQKRMGEYTVLAKLSLCKVAKLLIEFTLQQGCFTLFYLQMCCISLRRYYFELESRVIIKTMSHPFYSISFDWFS